MKKNYMKPQGCVLAMNLKENIASSNPTIDRILEGTIHYEHVYKVDGTLDYKLISGSIVADESDLVNAWTIVNNDLWNCVVGAEVGHLL